MSKRELPNANKQASPSSKRDGGSNGNALRRYLLAAIGPSSDAGPGALRAVASVQRKEQLSRHQEAAAERSEAAASKNSLPARISKEEAASSLAVGPVASAGLPHASSYHCDALAFTTCTDRENNF